MGFILLLLVFLHVVCSQLPPGVPPQQAQGVVPPHQTQGVVPPHQAQGVVPPHQAQGGVPPQQAYQANQGQVPPQQVPQGQVHQNAQAGHGHHPPVTEGRGGETLRFKNDVHNVAHVMEHLQEVIETKPKDQMSEEELEFHYFKMHDYNSDNKLDGVEIGKALTHFHGDESKPSKIMSDDDIASVVDLVLKEDDLNGDGYVEYFEFITSQRQIRDKKLEKIEQERQEMNPEQLVDANVIP